MALPAPRRPPADRLTAALLALAIQATFLALLLYAFQQFASPPRRAAETLLLLPRLAVLQPAPATIDARGRTIPPRVFTPAAPSSTAPVAPGAVAPAPDVQALGRSLFNCTPEAFANLSPEERARCNRPGEGLAATEPPNLMGGKSHVQDEAHWKEELAREQSPTMLPCLGGVDVLCLLKKFATGQMSDFSDPRTWPHYEVKQIAPEDFYKIEQAYDAWHKAHPAPDEQGHLAPAH